MVRAQLKQLDPLLDIQWFPHVAEGRYGLTCRWPQADRRWEMYHAGEIGEPFDILGWFTQAAAERGDLQDASSLPVEPALLIDKVLDFLGRCDNERQPWRHRMKQAIEANQRRDAELTRQAVDEAVGGLEYYKRKLGRIQQAPGAKFDATGKLVDAQGKVMLPDQPKT